MKGFNLFHKDKRKRVMALILTAVMVLSYLPAKQVEAASPGAVTTVADPETLHRPIDIYGHDTLHAGKITVGKSVSDDQTVFSTMDGVNLGGLAPADNNFLVTLSQSAQAMGLASKLPVPIDAVFVLDTSGSMDDPENDPRYINMISAANDAIATLMAANNQNRVAVVAFSSEDYGAGTSNDAAANVLSDLAHYDGDAASAHLQRVNSSGEASASGEYVAGRKSETITTYETQRVQVGTDWRGNPIYDWRNVEVTKNINAYRKAQEGGTNIQAGIALGASLLMDSTKSTTAQVNGKTVTRMPFIIVLSDGSPTFSATASNWYDASSIAAAGQQGPGSAPYAGNGFLAAMVAAYYKGAITERYFGENASEDNRCNIYTVGVDIGSDMTVSETALAEMTLNPAEEYVNTNSWYNTMQSYVDSYTAGNAFNINVGGSRTEGRNTVYFDSNFNINRTSITNSRNYVNGNNASGINMYAGGFRYNDDYFESDGDAASLNDTFKELVRLIQIKAISVPTDTSVSADFGGYVHFYDPIGEYMEVKNIHGIVSDGYFFRGASFAKNMVNYGTADANPVFDSAMTAAFNGRLELSDSGAISAAEIKALKDQVIAADGQLYYNNNTDYNNSFCWWGNSYTDDHGDEHVQYMGFANDDSIEAIEAAVSANQIPAGADYVCRSYYYHGTAGGEIDPVADFLLMAVRVQRSLTAPYQQTVYVSIPGSLLSVDRVLITEDQTQNPHTFESFVQTENPIRVIYEVGLQSDINSYNVAQKLAGTAYVAEKTLDKPAGGHEVDNYDSTTDTYYFYTNDWDRSKLESEHTRALAHAGFDVAADNDFYTFVEDTPLYADTNGTKLTTAPVPGNIYYYQRTYYDWTGNAPKNTAGTIFDCTEKTAYIEVVAPDAASIANATDTNASGEYYVKAGTYTASSLSTDTDDVLKEGQNGGPANPTGTSIVVAHPMRTNDLSDSHYTTLLGNNGRLALKAEKAKSVEITKNDASNTLITNADGVPVTIGDKLTYSITVVNEETGNATAVVTDKVPAGTKLEDPLTDISHSGVYNTTDKSITWNLNMTPGQETTVSFTVVVTEEVLTNSVVTIDNTATIQIGNNPAYNTNTTVNPPQGKMVETDDPTVDLDNGIKVGQELHYYIEYVNYEKTPANITIEDIVPTGTTVLTDRISDSGTYDSSANKITWHIQNVAAGASGSVDFYVVVNETAVTPIANGATIQIGSNSFKTNTTGTPVLTGNLAISKEVDNAITGTSSSTQEFNLKLTTRTAQYDGARAINGEYDAEITNSGTTVSGYKVIFANGVATTMKNPSNSVVNLTIKDGDTIVIKNLPAGLEVNVEETGLANGYVATYKVGAATTQYISVVPTDAVTGTPVATMEITNVYTPQAVTFSLEGSKSLETISGYLGDTVFNFGLWASNASGTISGSPINTAEVTLSSASSAAKTFSFAPRTISTPGTYYYVIKEISAAPVQGVTYDATQYLIKVVVEDDHNGNLTATPTVESTRNGDGGSWTTAAAGTKIEFANEYEPKELVLNLTALKQLTGRTLQDNEFSFVVKEGINTVSTGAVTNIATGKVEFTPITFYAPGEHTFKVSEVNANEPNITYDDTVYTVFVKVEDVSGHLTITQQTVNSANVNLNANSLGTFQNHYAPDSIDITLEGTKYLKQGNLVDDTTTPVTLTGDEFTFVVAQTDNLGNVLSGKEQVSVGENGASNTSDVNLGAAINFAPISYTLDTTLLTPGGTGIVTIDTLYYKISEVAPNNDYMDYDEQICTVIVPILYNYANGELSVGTISYAKGGGTSASFTNIQYPDSITVTPTGTKTTTSWPSTLSGSFSFAVREVDTTMTDNTGALVATGVAHSKDTGAGHTFSNEKVTFTPITFTEAGIYQYWIMETNSGTQNGITYDPARYLMTVEVTQPNGRLTIDNVNGIKYHKSAGTVGSTTLADYTSVVSSTTFGNAYAATGSLTLTATKAMNGAALTDGQFSFRVERIDGLASQVVNGQNKSDGSIEFATLYYTNTTPTDSNGIIKYKMTEVIPTHKQPGVTYDDTIYYVYVKLVDGGGGVMNASVDHVTKEENGQEVTLQHGLSDVVFKNSYAPVTTTLTASKNLTGRPQALQANEFTFELYRVTPSGSGYTETLVAATGNDAAGNVKFNLTYPANVTAGTYTYVMRELHGGSTINGITYSSEDYWVQVTIADANNKLGITGVEYYAENPLADSSLAPLNSSRIFENTYKATSTSYTPVSNKNLTGRTLKDNEFSFQIAEIESPRVSSNAITAGTVVSTGYNKANGSVLFTDLHFDEVGTYKFVISEVQGTTGGISYDNSKYCLVIEIVDNNIGGFVVQSAEYFTYVNNAIGSSVAIADVTFNNTYTIANGAVQLAATKILNGRQLAANEFDFVITDINGKTIATGDNSEMKASGEASKITFGTIGYTHADFNGVSDPDGDGIRSKVFTYWMKEITPPNNTIVSGIDFDDKMYKVEVTVTENGFGTMSTDVKYFELNAGATVGSTNLNDYTTEVKNFAGDPIAPYFTNEYLAEATSVTIEATKSLLDKKLENQEFTFVLTEINYPTGSASLTTSLEAKNDANGKAVFQVDNLTAAGTYKYTLTEAAMPTSSTGTYTPDPIWNTGYTVTVVVKDDGLGKLYVESETYSLNGNTVAGASFINRYTPNKLAKDLSVEINAQKTVTSQNPYTLTAGEFTFVVKDSADQVVTYGINDANGNVKFYKDITNPVDAYEFEFTQAGDYHYWISEVVDPAKDYYTYDARTWEIRVHVKYNFETGELYIDNNGVSIYSSNGTKVPYPPFVNAYNPTPVSLTITADKVLTGRPMQAGEFIFRVLEGDVIRAESHNDADGNIVFNFTESVAGTHTYKIVEVEPTTAAGGVQYDTQTVGTVQVTVTDAGDGQIKIDGNAIYTGADVAVFTNTYTPAPVDAVITAKKVLHGAQLGAGTFTFELVDRTTGAVVDTATNDADGNITFTKQFDTVGQYPFLIQEKAGADSTITYDTTQFALVVEIEDDLAGHLIASVDYQRPAVFENTYTPPVVPEPESDIIYKSFAFSKVWDDNNNAAGKRPDSITLELYQDGVYVTDMTLTAADGWIGSTVLMYSQGDHVYEWTIKEKDVPQGYKASYAQSAYTVTNTYGNGKAGSTGTGDNSNIGLYIGLSAVCVAAIAALLVLMKVRKKEDEE